MLYLEGESLLLISHIQVNFWDILPETSKCSAFWDMGVDSHLKWPLLFSPNEAGELGWHQSRCESDLCTEALTHYFLTARE